jgi:hypothetical protein
MKTKQISVFLENKRGRLAELTRLLTNNGINLRALALSETGDFGILRLVVSDPDRVQQILIEDGFTVTETEVLAVELADHPGGLAQVIEPLAAADINVEYLYAFAGQPNGKAIVIFRLNEIERAIKLLSDLGVHILAAEEVYAL